jgi:intein/homing endonuclease
MNTTTENGKNVVGDIIRREEQLSWLGGFFCGDGCITIYNQKRDNRKRICTEASLVNTDKILLERVEEILRVNGIKPIIYWSQREKYKPLGVIKIVGNNKLVKFLTLLLPYLFGNKSEVAKILLKFIYYRLTQPHGNQWIKPELTENPIIQEMIGKVRILNGSPQRLHAILPEKEGDIVSSI